MTLYAERPDTFPHHLPETEHQNLLERIAQDRDEHRNRLAALFVDIEPTSLPPELEEPIQEEVDIFLNDILRLSQEDVPPMLPDLHMLARVCDNLHNPVHKQLFEDILQRSPPATSNDWIKALDHSKANNTPIVDEFRKVIDPPITTNPENQNDVIAAPIRDDEAAKPWMDDRAAVHALVYPDRKNLAKKRRLDDTGEFEAVPALPEDNSETELNGLQ